MNRQELKQTLKNQALSFDVDVQKKLLYLQGDNVSSEDEEIPSYVPAEDDFLEAFVDEPDSPVSSLKSANSYFQSFEYNNLREKALHNQYVTDEDDYPQATRQKSEYQDRKRSFAERIAALRGVSLPGDYLRHRPE